MAYLFFYDLNFNIYIYIYIYIKHDNYLIFKIKFNFEEEKNYTTQVLN